LHSGCGPLTGCLRTAETLRRPEQEQSDFQDFLGRLRKPKNKAEFDQFMAERRSRSEMIRCSARSADAIRNFTKLYSRDIDEKTPAPNLLACRQSGLNETIGEPTMVDQTHSQPSSPEPIANRTNRSGRRGMLVIALLAAALLVSLTGNILSTALGQGFAWDHFGVRHGAVFGGPLTPAQIDDRIDRMTKHMAIELDATADQQVKIANIAKAAVADLRPLREKAQAARSQAVALLTAPTIDRTAIERLRAEQIGLAETASKRIAQALSDAAEALNPEQRRKVADWVSHSGGWWGRWHHG
jgi:Spy/CpxP family protein refolding chaperone